MKEKWPSANELVDKVNCENLVLLDMTETEFGHSIKVQRWQELAENQGFTWVKTFLGKVQNLKKICQKKKGSRPNISSNQCLKNEIITAFGI